MGAEISPQILLLHKDPERIGSNWVDPDSLQQCDASATYLLSLYFLDQGSKSG